jgi:hypothetical protein
MLLFFFEHHTSGRLSLPKPLWSSTRRVRLVVERGTPLAELRDEIEAAEVPLERIVVRPGPTAAEEDEAELVMAKGSREEEVLSLIDGLRRVSGVREVNSALNGSAQANSEQ